MIQTVRKKLKVLKVQRHLIVLLAGVSPLILALMLALFVMRYSTMPHDMTWTKYLIQHQNDIFQTLIVSSVLVAVFSTLLRSKVVTFAATLQPALIQAMFILTNETRQIALHFSLFSIIVLPLLILTITLRREIDQEMMGSPKNEKSH